MKVHALERSTGTIKEFPSKKAIPKGWIEVRRSFAAMAEEYHRLFGPFGSWKKKLRKVMKDIDQRKK